jgi:hypothetical protein
MSTWQIVIEEARRLYGPQVTNGDILGFLPEILRQDDPRSAAAQIEDRYSHGGGWSPFGRGQWQWSRDGMVLQFPGDPPMKPVAALLLPLSNEYCLLFPHQMMLVLQQDGSFEVTRLD